jgi:hypothetical protein
MLLGTALWWPGEGRTFPLLPLFDFLNGTPVYVNWIPAMGLFFSCILYAMGRLTARVFLPVVLLCAATLCVLDLNRLQVWLWMWLLLWVVDALDTRRGAPSGFQQWVLAGMYFWSGLFKMTPWFQTNFDWFCEAFALTQPLSGNVVLPYITGAVEALAGLLLLFPATRKVGKWVITALHVYILLVLGPLGHHWNRVVWPWNVAMIGWVWCYFSGHERVRPAPAAGYWVVGVVVWLMPVLNKWQWWPESLSWKMYSNTHREASIIAPNGNPCPALASVWPADQINLEVSKWATHDLQSPPFNSMANFKNALRYVRACGRDSVDLEVLTVGWWDQEEHIERGF